VVTERAAGFALLLDPQKGKKRMLDSDRLESWRERGGGGERVLLLHPLSSKDGQYGIG
jgi:hypothetical protein